jgi:hypothetical protein
MTPAFLLSLSLSLLPSLSGYASSPPPPQLPPSLWESLSVLLLSLYPFPRISNINTDLYHPQANHSKLDFPSPEPSSEVQN